MTQKPTKAVCVYCSSSEAVDGSFREAAEEFGACMARAGYDLVFGGTRTGLMAVVAEAFLRAGASVAGVIPEPFLRRGIAFQEAHELVVTAGMRSRKAVMAERADAFVCLPGGFGTLEELLETITQKQLRYHNKPIVLLNTCGFYDRLLEVFEEFYRARFANPSYRDLYAVAARPEDVLRYLENYRPPESHDPWLSQAAETSLL